MQTKKQRLFEEAQAFLINNKDELKTIIDDFQYTVPEDDDNFIEILSTLIIELHIGYMDKSFNIDDCLEYIKYYRQNNYFECVKLLFYAYKYAFFELEINLDDTDRLSRTIYIPVRSSLADIAYGVLTSIKATDNHLFTLEIDNIKYASSLVCKGEDDDFEYASGYLSLLISKHKSFKLLYDDNEQYSFNIKVKLIVYIEEDYYKPVIIKNIKGYGILENDKKSLFDYFNGNNDSLKEFDDFDLDEFQSDLEQNFFRMKIFYENFYNDTEDVS